MSNTSEITPYRNSPSAVDAVLGAAALCSWLFKSTDEDKLAVKEGRAMQMKEKLFSGKSGQCLDLSAGSIEPVCHTAQHPCRQEIISDKSGLLDTSRCQPLSEIQLNMGNLDSLALLARNKGYNVVKANNIPAGSEIRDALLLEGSNGQRFAMCNNSRGTVSIVSSGAKSSITELVREHTLQRALEHLKSSGMEVKQARLASGDIQILAREKQAKTDGKATVKAQIRKDGSTFVDVGNIKGGRCENIVQDLARAVGGEVAKTTRKANSFSLPPGEPARIKTGG